MRAVRALLSSSLPLLIKGPTGCGKTRWSSTWPRAWAAR
jgi:MoxR-like ATPase